MKQRVRARELTFLGWLNIASAQKKECRDTLHCCNLFAKEKTLDLLHTAGKKAKKSFYRLLLLLLLSSSCVVVVVGCWELGHDGRRGKRRWHGGAVLFSFLITVVRTGESTQQTSTNGICCKWASCSAASFNPFLGPRKSASSSWGLTMRGKRPSYVRAVPAGYGRTDGWADRQSDTQTDIHTDKHTDRQYGEPCSS